LIPFSLTDQQQQQQQQQQSPSLLSSSLNQFLNLFSTKHTYKLNEKVDLLVNSATSKNSNIPYSYYNLPFICPPSENVKPVHMSLAEILNGNNFMQSDYKLYFGKDEPCLRICDRIVVTRNILKSIDLIKNDYIADWIIDGLPASTTFITDSLDDEKKYYIPGFSLGYIKNNEYFLNNHLMMVIRYHKELNNEFSIVGFEIYPKSVEDYHCPGASRNYKNLKLDSNAETQLLQFTYSVYWREDNQLEYKDRWKLYIDPSLIDSNGKLINNNNNINNNLNKSSNNKTIHWVSLINSFVIISFVSLIVGFIFLITFNSNIKDIDIDLDIANNNINTNNFNLIALNSFKSPIFLPLLSILTGSGIQLIFTLLASGLFSSILFRNPIGNTTTIFSVTISILIIGGFFAGFSAIQFFKLFTKNNNNNNNILSYRKTLIISSLSGSIVISICLLSIVITNLLVFQKNSPRSMKFSSFLSIFTMYTLLQIPISIIGGLISKNFNVFTNLIQKKLPISNNNNNNNNNNSTPLYLRFPFSILIIGILPCSIVFIESRFIYTALLNTRSSTSSFIYGFYILAAILLSIIMIEIGIIATYLFLNKSKNNFNWQWWTFINCSLSIWIYLVSTSVYQLIYKLNLDSSSPILYMVYTTILNSIISIACGSLALWSATIFIYTVILSSDVKKD
jgi:transmembrane 9 superfamily protein 2/4